MGKSALQTSKEFIEDYDRRYKASKQAVEARQGKDFNIAQLAEEEEKKERAYRREERNRNRRRQAGLMGTPAQGVIPAAVSDNSNNSGNSSGGGAVSGTDSESESDTKGRMVKDISSIEWNTQLESKLEEVLIRNVFDFK